MGEINLTEAEREALRFISTFDDGDEPSWDWDGYWRIVDRLESLGSRGLTRKTAFYPHAWTLTDKGRAVVEAVERGAE